MRKLYIALMALILSVAMLAPVSAHVPASHTGPRVGSYSRIANYGSLRLRTGPGYDYSTKTYIPKGAIVKVISGPHSSDWYKVSYRGETGYSYAKGLVHTGLAGASLAQGYSKIVVVSRARQQMEVYQNGSLYFVSAITTGQPKLPTPLGTYKVMAKLSPYKMVSPWPKGSEFYYDSVMVQYAIRFRSDGFYLHDAPWAPYNGYGTNVPHTDPDGVYRTGSHGCVRAPLWAEAKLFNWISIGTTVKIIDY